MEGKHSRCTLAEHYASSNDFGAIQLLTHDGHQYRGLLFSPDDTWAHAITFGSYEASLEEEEVRGQVAEFLSRVRFTDRISPNTSTWKDQAAEDIAELNTILQLSKPDRQ